MLSDLKGPLVKASGGAPPHIEGRSRSRSTFSSFHVGVKSCLVRLWLGVTATKFIDSGIDLTFQSRSWSVCGARITFISSVVSPVRLPGSDDI